MPIERYTFGEVLDLRASERGEQVYLWHDGEPVTFVEAAGNARAAANQLLGLGLRPGDTIAIFTSNCRRAADVWFGAPQVGVLVVLLNTALKGDYLAEQLRDSGACALLVDDDLLAVAGAVAGSVPDLRLLLVRRHGGDDAEIERACDGLPSGVLRVPDTVLDEGDRSRVCDGRPIPWDEPAFVMYTSGTTGRSKGVVFTQHYECTASRVFAETIGTEPTDVMFSTLPMFHQGAAMSVVVAGLMSGRSSALDSVFHVSTFWDRVRHFNATQLQLVGPMLVMLWNLAPSEDDASTPARVAIAAPVPVPLHRPIEERYGLKILSGYAMTEVTFVAAHHIDDDVVPGTAGRPSPLYEVRVVDDDDEDVPLGEPGEIVVRPRGTHVMFEGYLNRPAETLAQMRNLWFHTGDLGAFDATGNLLFIDRKKDAIRRRGENISSFEVEQAVLAHAAVEECAAHAVPSPLGEDDVKICVVLSIGADVTEEELAAHCESLLPKFAVPRYVELVDELPKTPTMRARKHLLRERGDAHDVGSSGRGGGDTMTSTAEPSVADAPNESVEVTVRHRTRPAGPSATEVITYCRICEPLCGMVATVDGGQVVGIQGDREHPVSQGYLCSKGFAMVDVQRDPDRVLYPLKRVGGPGEFERCTWDEALDDISARLRDLIKRHGKDSIGAYLGNPAGMHTGHMYWLMGFIGALGSPHAYSPNTQDTATRMAASHFLYGSPLPIPFPDVRRTSFLLMFGANPLMSKGSLLTVPRVRDRLNEIVERGGRVVAVDPRRSETAQAFEHVAIRADTDAWLLLALVGEVFRQGLEDRDFLDRHTSGAAELRAAAIAVTPEMAAERTGVPADEIRDLAHGFATAESAVAYTRTGVCTGSFGTLVNFLVDSLNAITGNLDSPGGAVFGNPPLSFDELGARFGMASYATRRTRIGGLPEVAGLMASTAMPEEITTPGPGQLRALIVGAGNPVLTTPGSVAVEESLEQLDLLVALDLYVTETSKHAHYILPGTTFLERADLPGTLLQWAATPFVQATPKVVDPPGECREEWRFYDEMARRLGLGGPWAFRSARVLARLGLLRLTPMRMVDLMLRTGRHGDRFGLRRGGLSLRKVLASPHGLLLDDYPATGVLRRKVQHRDRRVHVFHPDLGAEVDRLHASPTTDPEYPLRLIGRRETRSHNSWMHNVPSKHRQARLQLNPKDAARAGIADGDIVRVESRDGTVKVAVEVTDVVVSGTVTLPHGWGHDAGWRHANEAGGVNYNVLTSSRVETAERISGMSHLNGVGVRLVAVASPDAAVPV